MKFLEIVIEEKKKSIRRKKDIFSQEELVGKIGYVVRKTRFKDILNSPGLHLIAEIKRASPSKGNLKADLDVVQIASLYEKSGVELVSVLSEEKFFKGSVEDVYAVSEQTTLSVLEKDFVIDRYQIYEAKAYGADAVLLIAAILTQEQITDFLSLCANLKMDAIVEVHTQEDLDKVLGLETIAEIIGINHRNLEDLTVDLGVSGKLLPKIPNDRIIIAESGISSVLQVQHFKKLGLQGVLIGESLMTARDIEDKLKELLIAAR